MLNLARAVQGCEVVAARAAPARGSGRDHGRRTLLIDVGEIHVRALSAKQLDRGAADAGRAAGDESGAHPDSGSRRAGDVVAGTASPVSSGRATQPGLARRAGRTAQAGPRGQGWSAVGINTLIALNSTWNIL